MCNPSKLSGVLSRAAAVALVVGTVSVRPVAAQVNTFHACYVPTVGAMYMIKLTGLPPTCLSPSHTEIIWTDSGGVANGSITTLKLADTAVTTIKLAPAAVTAAQLASGAVGSAQVQDGSITGTDLAANAVGSAQLANGAVGSLQLASGSVGSAQVLDGSLAGVDLAAGAVGASQIGSGVVNTIHLAPGAVTNSIIAAQAVNSTKILDGSVTRVKLGSDAFTAIAWGFVNSDGTLGAHSTNVTSTWNAAALRYEITIAGESYFFSNYATIVTPTLSTPLTTMLIPNVASFQNKLHVQLLSATGSSTQGNFQFVTFK